MIFYKNTDYQADVNGDNQVDFNEFKAMMTAK